MIGKYRVGRLTMLSNHQWRKSHFREARGLHEGRAPGDQYSPFAPHDSGVLLPSPMGDLHLSAG